MLLGIVLLSLCRADSFAQQETRAPAKYELALVYVWEGEAPEFLFVVGSSGFKSVETLKRFLGELPPGSEVTWAPGCERLGNEPLLSSEREMGLFREFLAERRIRFTLIPSG